MVGGVSGAASRSVLALTTGLDSYQAWVLDGARAVLLDHGYSLIAHVHHGPASTLVPSLERTLARRPPCALLTTNPLPPRQDRARRELVASLGLPSVHLGQDIAGEPCVRADNVQGMTVLMQHLLDERGVRAPVLIRGASDQPDHVDREVVFRRELAARGLPVDEGLVLEGRCEAEVAREEMRQLLLRRRDLDAVVTMDDWSAFAVQQALAEAGLSVPEDVVVTGFDDFPIASLTWPSLTTVNQDLAGQGAAAARLLLDRLAGPTSGAGAAAGAGAGAAAAEHVLTPCRVVVRGSTAGAGVGAGEVSTVREVSRSAREHLAAQSAVTRISCALNQCRTVDDVRDALTAWLEPLGVRRLFLVVYEGEASGPQPEGALQQASRLVLDYRGGRAHPPPPDTFSPHQLLPDELRDEETAGYLALQPLAVSRGVLGYLLVDHVHSPLPVAESLRLDVGRTLEAIFSTRDLEAHLAELELLVASRTREIEAEVRIRRLAEQRLQAANAELQRSVNLDGLTRIANRTAFQEYLEELWSRLADSAGELAMVMLDVDVFKAYNDRYGHLLGDEALRVVASCLERSVRGPDDLACRYGGEEFVMLLPDTGLDGALDVAAQIRRRLAVAAVRHEASPLSRVITASMGVCAVVPRADHPPETLLDAADRALYRAKEQGRDRIAVGTLGADGADGAGGGLDRGAGQGRACAGRGAGAAASSAGTTATSTP